jgi:protein-disulfide isomerase
LSAYIDIRLLFKVLLVFIFLKIFLYGNLAYSQSLPPDSVISSERILGQPKAPIELIEYASLTCPHCAKFHNGPWVKIKKEYVDTGKAKLIYRDFPTDQLALAASMIARCAPKTRYFGIVKIMFETQDNWRNSQNPRQALANIGRIAGMSLETVNQCINSKVAYESVMRLREEGSKKFNIDSTPTLIVNGEKIESGLKIEDYRKLFDKLLKKVKSK